MKLKNVTEVEVERTCKAPKPCKENEGKLLVWNSVNPPSEMQFYEVNTPEEAKSVINHLSNEQLKDDSIFANGFGLLVCELEVDGTYDWMEWENDEADDIIQVMREEEIEAEKA